ncbi:Peptidyl-prolyl cis-trans isomerase A precursor [Gimesia alba]|uniref:peptidylprolyl isomerase n=1 Tax=Gimesia alba TaxID=2527973 RepID=A0A517RLB9_9PLAN|nr:peptidylprolyl isomerase [Gimesia alba]QDT44667.1 Peptidyl-prolyl cis-trans isomerase A precursor [Gimesia alba]
MKTILILSLMLVATVVPGISQEANAAAPETYRVKMETTKGTFYIDVTRSWSPNGADRFYELVNSGFYNDCAFFRVIEGFMAQVGINGAPATQAKWRDQTIQDDPVAKSNLRGYVSFAKTGAPNSRTTQIFINFGDNRFLDGLGFAPFGAISQKGMKVVDALYSGYGEGAPSGRGPSQQRIQQEGNQYLKQDFPRLDYITKATIVKN